MGVLPTMSSVSVKMGARWRRVSDGVDVGSIGLILSVQATLRR